MDLPSKGIQYDALQISNMIDIELSPDQLGKIINGDAPTTYESLGCCTQARYCRHIEGRPVTAAPVKESIQEWESDRDDLMIADKVV